jgi:arsenate reductase (glutaredoxin)
MIKFYGYNKCSTCQKAKKYLLSKKMTFNDLDITETPPTKTVLKSILKTGEYTLKDLFNKSGVQYRELNMKEKIKVMTEAELIDLLASNGKLVKRPIVTDGKRYSVGFKEDIFKQQWR